MTDTVGTSCPANFVQIKAGLDRSESGAPLDVLVSDKPVGRDLTDSMRMSSRRYDVLFHEFPRRPWG